MDIITNNLSTLMLILGGLIALTNIIVEVIKNAIPDSKVPTNLVAVFVAIIVTVLAYIIWANVTGIAIIWWHVVAAIVVGILVAYGAMFGFDKLKQTIESIKS
jgi:glucan phosphoethanolaminetransferase (alkaline phosphatase superfamily)